jgi:hypothetical protein
MQENENTRTTTIEFDVKVKTFDVNKGELIDAIASGSKLTKVDAVSLGKVVKDSTLIIIDACENDGGCGCPKITLESTSEVTE